MHSVKESGSDHPLSITRGLSPWDQGGPDSFLFAIHAPRPYDTCDTPLNLVARLMGRGPRLWVGVSTAGGKVNSALVGMTAATGTVGGQDMSITFYCPTCNKKLKANPADAGRKTRCGGCQQTLYIPGAAAASPPVQLPPNRSAIEPRLLFAPRLLPRQIPFSNQEDTSKSQVGRARSCFSACLERWAAWSAGWQARAFWRPVCLGARRHRPRWRPSRNCRRLLLRPHRR